MSMQRTSGADEPKRSLARPEVAICAIGALLVVGLASLAVVSANGGSIAASTNGLTVTVQASV